MTTTQTTARKQPHPDAAHARSLAIGAPEPSQRDLVLDFLRGVAMAVIVIDHASQPSLFDYFTRERVALVTAAEVFVLISGIVIGMVYRRKAEQLGLSEASWRLFDRAFQIYRALVVTTLILAALRWLGSFIVPPLATVSPDRLSEINVDYVFPASWLQAIADILTLRASARLVNILGLYVALLLITPMCLAMLRGKRTRSLLAISWIVYGVNAAYHIRLTGCVFETRFPLMTWQLIYVNALAAGFHREWIKNAMTARRGFWLWIACVCLAVVFAIFAWTVPGQFVPRRLHLIPAATATEIYQTYFSKVWLGAGRLVNLVVLFIALYGLCMRWWEPIRKAFGWYFLPIGQATLYVFLIHSFLLLAITNTHSFLGASHVLNTVAIAVILAMVWLLVRFQILFGVIPV